MALSERWRIVDPFIQPTQERMVYVICKFFQVAVQQNATRWMGRLKRKLIVLTGKAHNDNPGSISPEVG